jgi:hypothetical protein
MRYGAIEVLASNSVHGNLLAHIVRVPMQSGNFIGMARLPVRSRTSLYSKKAVWLRRNESPQTTRLRTVLL